MNFEPVIHPQFSVQCFVYHCLTLFRLSFNRFSFCSSATYGLYISSNLSYVHIVILSILSFVHSRKTSHRRFSRKMKRILIRSFNFKFRYIDDVLSLNKVDDFVDCIYAIELEIKDTQIQRGILHALTYTLTLTVTTR